MVAATRRPSRGERLAKAAQGDDDAPMRVRTPYQLEKARRKAESKIEGKLRAAFEARLAAQRDAVLALLRRKGLRPEPAEKSAVLDTLGALAKADGEDKPKKIRVTDAEIREAIAKPLAREIESAIRAGVEDGGAVMADGLGISWQESDPTVVDYLEQHGLDLVDDLDAVTVDRVQQALAAGYDAGEGGAAMIERVHDAGAFSAGRAGNIARTEAHTAVASGNFLALQQAGERTHTWYAAPNARPTHQDASGQSVKVGEPFEVGEAELLYPGDPVGGAGYPEETVNCRCNTLGDPLDETAPADLAEGLDVDGDDALADKVRAAAEDLDPQEVSRVDPSDVDPLTVRAGDITGYDPETGELTLAPRVRARDIQDALREHMVSSLLTPADARAFENQLELYDLPKPKIKGGELKRAAVALRAIVTRDWDAAGELFGGELTDEQRGALKVLADNFWTGGGVKGPATEKR